MDMKWWILIAVAAVIVLPIKLRILKRIMEKKDHKMDE